MLIVVVGLYVSGHSEILVQQRPPGAPSPGMWEMPGGKLDPGETMRKALEREWEEELGIFITVGDFVDECVVTFPAYGPVLLPLFEVDIGRQTPIPRLGQIIRMVTYEQMHELPGLDSMTLYSKAVKAYIERRASSSEPA